MAWNFGGSGGSGLVLQYVGGYHSVVSSHPCGSSKWKGVDKEMGDYAAAAAGCGEWQSWRSISSKTRGVMNSRRMF